MPFRTDDPVADWDRHCARQQSELDKLPTCCECDEPIQSDECYEINGELICPGCLNEHHKKRTDDYIE